MAKGSAVRQGAPEPDVLAPDTGQRIRGARLARGMSEAELAGDEFSRSFIGAVELGRRRISLPALAILAERLDMVLEDFLDGSPAAHEAAAAVRLDRALLAMTEQRPTDALCELDRVNPTDSTRPRHLYLRGWALVVLGRSAEAIPLLEAAASAYSREPDPSMPVRARYTLAMALHEAGRYDESLDHLRLALDEATRECDDASLQGKITVALGHLRVAQGKLDDAVTYYERARDLFSPIDDLDNLGAIYSGLSRVHGYRHQYRESLHYARLSARIFQSRRSRRHGAQELNQMAGRSRDLGELEAAVEQAQRAVAWAVESKAADIEGLARATLASIYLDMDQRREARIEAETVQALGLEETSFGNIEATIVLARLAALGRNERRADELYRRALAGLRERGFQAGYADAALGYSFTLQQRGDIEAALQLALDTAQA